MLNEEKVSNGMNYPDLIQEKAKKAGVLWKKREYQSARHLYDEIIDSISFPLDKAKMLANIAQLYEQEGNVVKAVTSARTAIAFVNEHELFKSLEGSHLRGCLTGLINRLHGKRSWEALPYEKDIPIEMNLNIYDRVRVHLSVGVISGVLIATLSSNINIPSLDIPFLHKKIIVFSSSGFLFSVFFTSKLLQQATYAIMSLSGRSMEKSLKPAANFLSSAAVLYLLFMPSAFWSMVSDLVFFILTGIIGVVVFFCFICRKHGKKLDDKS